MYELFMIDSRLLAMKMSRRDTGDPNSSSRSRDRKCELSALMMLLKKRSENAVTKISEKNFSSRKSTKKPGMSSPDTR